MWHTVNKANKIKSKTIQLNAFRLFFYPKERLKASQQQLSSFSEKKLLSVSKIFLEGSSRRQQR
jgi:hypothetical protein